MVIVDSSRPILGGVDAHRDVNVAAVVDMNGGLLGVESFRTTADGHKMLALWMSGFGTIERVGVEGTGTYGASVARHLARMAVTVIDVDRPNRQQRRQHGKSDQLDAIEAARGALSGRCTGRAKCCSCRTSNRYRLNSGGNRQANNALWRIVITRLGQHEPRTVAHMNRRLAEGKSKPEIIRCLKRYVARETFQALLR